MSTPTMKDTFKQKNAPLDWSKFSQDFPEQSEMFETVCDEMWSGECRPEDFEFTVGKDGYMFADLEEEKDGEHAAVYEPEEAYWIEVGQYDGPELDALRKQQDLL